MKTIINEKNEIQIIKKSKFISYIKKVYNTSDANNYLEEIKNIHNDATHVCYAYIIDNQIKFNDDGEPNSTAGLPILEVLRKNDLNYVLAIVVRYFGGIKLGSNGLIRAYSNSTKSLIDDNMKDIEIGYYIIIEEDYSKNDLINYLLKNSTIVKKDYSNKIYLEVIITKDVLEKLGNINFSIKEEVFL